MGAGWGKTPVRVPVVFIYRYEWSFVCLCECLDQFVMMDFTVNNPISIGYEFNQQSKSSSVTSPILEHLSPTGIPFEIN